MLPENIWELAALYALDLLDESECRVLEEAIAQFPELQPQLAKFQETVSAIPYSAPPVPVAVDLKARLFERIASQALEPNSASVEALREQATKISWEPFSIPGMAIAKLYVNDEKREMACFVRAVAGVQFPNHRHAGNEEIIVLEGDLVIDEKTYGSGDYIPSISGTVHQPETVGGCTIFLRTSLDDEIVES
jgi:hypothetical protein